MIVDPKTGKPTRIGHTVDKNGKKVRIALSEVAEFEIKESLNNENHTPVVR